MYKPQYQTIEFRDEFASPHGRVNGVSDTEVLSENGGLSDMAKVG